MKQKIDEILNLIQLHQLPEPIIELPPKLPKWLRWLMVFPPVRRRYCRKITMSQYISMVRDEYFKATGVLGAYRDSGKHYTATEMELKRIDRGL